MLQNIVEFKLPWNNWAGSCGNSGASGGGTALCLHILWQALRLLVVVGFVVACNLVGLSAMQVIASRWLVESGSGLDWPGLAWLQAINSARCGGNYVTILAIHNYRIQLQLHNSQANARRSSFHSCSLCLFLYITLSLSLSLLLPVIISSLVLHNPACHTLSKCILIKRALCKSIASKHVFSMTRRGREPRRGDKQSEVLLSC